MSRLRKGSAAFAVVLSMVAGFEGLRTVAYRDPVGIPTICFGETRGVKMGDQKTADECRQMLGDRLIEFSSGVDRCLRVDVPAYTYAAFVSFSYNVGVGAFCSSTLAKKANAGDLRGACNELGRWTRAKGLELPGLVARRAEERKWCLAGLV
ncbi:lysozyme [Devosia sp. 17-2-E-8]|nr:lysozyme [Devosia sp. 17-2-E-8]